MIYTILSTCNGGGYKYCRTYPKHPKANSKGLYPLHRVLMENKLGRNLMDNEEVHHKDDDKTNDDILNLEVKTKAEHAKYHHPKLPDVVVICDGCNNRFTLAGVVYNNRKQRNKSGLMFCSRPCFLESYAR